MEKATLRIRSELRSFNDSLVDIESRGRPSDWSYTDDNGKRWGISPGQIHINGHSLSPCKILLDPFTCQFRINDGVRQEQRARTELHREIQLQSARIEGDRQIRERLRAMESRRAAARDTLRRDRNNPS